MQRSTEQRVRAQRKQRGVALIFCLFALILLTSIALGLIAMTDTESRINQNFRTSQQAFFGANAGLEEARSRLTPGLAGGIAPPTVLPGGANSVIYIRNPKVVNGTLETIEPLNPASEWYDTELCHENHAGLGLANPGAGIPCATVTPPGVGWWTYVDSAAPGHGTTSALNFKWVRINLKVNASSEPFYVDGGADSTTHGTMVCWDGAREFLLPAGYTACDVPPVLGMVLFKPVLMVTAMAQGSRRITQMEVALNPPLITNAAVDSKDHVSLNGNLGVTGYDYCSCEKQVSGGVTTWVSRAGKTCDASKWAIYSASTVDKVTGKSEILQAGPDPPVAQNQPWIYDIDELVKTYKESPNVKPVTAAPYNWTCSAPPYPDCGTHSGDSFGVPPTFPPSPVDNPIGPENMAAQYTYVPGDLHITGGTQGNGVLIVDGDLEIDGGLQFYGLIIVKGVVKFTGGGSDKTNIYGAILAGERSIDNTVLGGSANIVYDYCSLLTARPPQPPTMISFRELMY